MSSAKSTTAAGRRWRMRVSVVMPNQQPSLKKTKNNQESKRAPDEQRRGNACHPLAAHVAREPDDGTAVHALSCNRKALCTHAGRLIDSKGPAEVRVFVRLCSRRSTKRLLVFFAPGPSSRRISQLVCARVRVYAWCSGAWLLYGPSATYGSSELLLPPALRDANGSGMVVFGFLQGLSLCLRIFG